MDAISYREQQVALLLRERGVYALCDLDGDLDGTPIYVGQSTDGVRQRVQRHLTSARSDVIANPQIDVWEIAYVWGWVEPEPGRINQIEARLFHDFDPTSPLMNGSVPANPGAIEFDLPEEIVVQVMSDDEIATRREPPFRLPRQAEHYQPLVDHILNVKDAPELRRALRAHSARLQAYHERFLDPDA